MTDTSLVGLRVVADGSLQRHSRGTVLMGGSPLRVMRVTENGARLVDRLLAGEAVPDSTAAVALTRRLLDGGLVHPVPIVGSFTADDVTVVIPVRGELPPRLVHTVGRVARVIVIDDNSPIPVDTPTRTDEGVPITLHRRSTRGGPAAARNTGLDAVTTALVAFIDADCEPEPDWLDALLPLFVDSQVALIAPRIVPTEPVGPQGALARFEHHRSALDLGGEAARVRARTRVSYVPSAAMVARTEVLRTLGGFDEEMQVGEDVDLVWRLDEADWSVRYQPTARVAHRHRTRPLAWARRRFDYGTSAGALALRHPGALAPVETSGWSIATWGLIASGHPFGGAAATGATAVMLSKKLDTLDQPLPAAAQLAARGHLAVGRSFAQALLRPFWPITLALLALVPNRRFRLTVATAALAPAVIDWVRQRPDLDPVSYVLCRVADDLAYGAGVWVGSLRAGTLDPLIPELVSWPRAGRYTRWREGRRGG
jgi:mycofactocin system glycosyltransferase